MTEKGLQKRLKEVGVPEHIIEGLLKYVMDGKPTGRFLKAVLEDKFLEVHKRADDINLRALHQIAGAVYNELPQGCHGSSEKVQAWIDKKGLNGIAISWWLEKEAECTQQKAT